MFNQYVMENYLNKSIDILKEQVYGWTPYPTFRGVGDAYTVPSKPMAVGRRHAMKRAFATNKPHICSFVAGLFISTFLPGTHNIAPGVARGTTTLGRI
jgi:hypothetical protein